jgi:LPXTG-motif cell wall-anchored protein
VCPANAHPDPGDPSGQLCLCDAGYAYNTNTGTCDPSAAPVTGECPANSHPDPADPTGELCICNAGYSYNTTAGTCDKVVSPPPGTTPTPGTTPGPGQPFKPPEPIQVSTDNTWLYLSAGGLLLAGGLYWYSKRKGKKLL